MLWRVVVVVLAALAAAQGQSSYDDAQPAVVPAPSSGPSPAPSFVVPAPSFVIPAPAPAPSFVFPSGPAPVPSFVFPAPAPQPAVIVQQPTSAGLSFVPPPQPSLLPVTQPATRHFGVPQGVLPPLPQCPSTYSLVHVAYQDSLYHFSWCFQPGHRFTHQQASDYCNSLNHLSQPYHFQVLRIDDTTEVSFIHYLLSYYAHAAVWTRDTTTTAPYSIRRFINRSGVNQPGHDCLSVEAALLALHSIWVHENTCSDAKLVVCEARY
ncbi:ribonuclease 3-like [Portunus trituberculatus]|uniref:ribonuclease 3-like n=1 Tax=Portunus trituberculatus TaxID=210409 RepID=UPI001E1CE40A|nr:ribonuclease 3-like [Portunus trituberculatus]